MSVLPRWGRARDGIEAVCFVTRNLVSEELATLFNRIDAIREERQASLFVIPCDEMGVCPTYAGNLDGVRGLPAYFLGLRPHLRRHLATRYGVRVVTEREGAQAHQALLGVRHEEVERASATLRDVEALQRTVEETVSSEIERAAVLAALSSTITTAREGLREAIRRYQEVWLGRREV
jgi:hypothetical protein